MKVVFSGPIKGICTRPGLWVEDTGMSMPLVYFQKPKWIKDDTAWEKFLRDVFVNVRLVDPEGYALVSMASAMLKAREGKQ